MDTNSNPDGIDFPIPGNDDARRSIDLYCNLMKETIADAKLNIKNLEISVQDEKKSGEKIISNKVSESKLN